MKKSVEKGRGWGQRGTVAPGVLTIQLNDSRFVAIAMPRFR